MRDNSQNDIDTAWKYHENADILFHSRLTSFVTSQSFLITGYTVSFLMPKADVHDWYSFSVRCLVAVLGMVYSISFYIVCDYLYRGMQVLKFKYLAGSFLGDKTAGDPIYQEYYYHRYATSRGSILGEAGFGRIIPRILPGFTFVFWFLLVLLEAVRLLRMV